jgi:hypothetical protein
LVKAIVSSRITEGATRITLGSAIVIYLLRLITSVTNSITDITASRARTVGSIIRDASRAIIASVLAKTTVMKATRTGLISKRTVNALRGSYACEQE